MHCLESLGGRTLFASYSAGNVTQLISAVNKSNGSAAADTIMLAAGATYSLTAVNNVNNFEGANGLPIIYAAGGGLTILGNGATIERSAAAGTPAFRLFHADFRSSLTLTDLTLQGGLATSQPGSSARGGAIFFQSGGGLLSLENVIVQNNRAVGADGFVAIGRTAAGASAAGGGIFAWNFTARNCTIRNNLAQSGRTASAPDAIVQAATVASGGGIFGAGSMTNCLITGNTARGGDVGAGDIHSYGGFAYGRRRLPPLGNAPRRHHHPKCRHRRRRRHQKADWLREGWRTVRRHRQRRA
jgi:hypothetical protein